jgi:hypothetical protein
MKKENEKVTGLEKIISNLDKTIDIAIMGCVIISVLLEILIICDLVGILRML